MDHLSSPSLVQCQRPSDCHGFFDPERLDSGPQSSVDDERIKLWEQHSKIGSWHLAKTIRFLERCNRLLHIGCQPVALGGALPNIDHPEIVSAILHHLLHALKDEVPASRHTADSDHAQLRLFKLRLRDESQQGGL